MDEEQIKSLLKSYRSGNISPEDKLILERWYNHHAESGMDADPVVMAQKLEELAARLPLAYPKMQRRLWLRIAAAVVVLLAVTFGIWIYNAAWRKVKEEQATARVQDITPGKNGAKITLANGEVIQLDSTKTGVIVGGIAGLRYDDGASISSSRGDVDRSSPSLRGGTTKQSLAILTASTSRRQTYTFTLPDGSKVWLNADSKLEFPLQFTGQKRRVKLSGEGYFSVKHNAKQPFFVESSTADGKAQIVEDIGTEFNINAYADAASIKTTLVEGAARVSSLPGTSSLQAGEAARQSPLQGEIASGASQPRNDGQVVTLVPNQQAIFRSPHQGETSVLQSKMSEGKRGAAPAIKVVRVDPSEAIAWKNGDFEFNAEPLGEIMKKLARWYDIDVVYKAAIQGKTFTGKISRKKNISQVLKVFSKTGAVNFKIEGRRVIISKN